MAKILSHVWASISGSVGGITYFNGPHAAIIARSRVTPVNPSSLLQTQSRASLAGASAQWEGLSDAVQALWQDYAQTVTLQGKQGSYTVTGRSLYIAGRQMQLYLAARGLYVPVYDPTSPVVPGLLLPSNLETGPSVAVGTGFRVTYSADLLDDTAFFVQRSGQFSKERHFWKGPWSTRDDQVDVVNAGAGGGVDFIGLVDQATYFFRVKAVADDAPGRVSAEWFGRVTAEVTGP